MRLVMLSLAYLGILTSSTAGILGVYGNYFPFVKRVAVNNAIHSSTTNTAALKYQAEVLIRQKAAYYGQHGSESTILLLMGLGMSCLAIWGSRRGPTQ